MSFNSSHLALENIIVQSPVIHNATVIGHKLPYCGILIEPTQPAPSDAAQYLESIWPIIEQANAIAPDHSKIKKELVIIGDPVERPIPKTVKGNNRRYEAVRM